MKDNQAFSILLKYLVLDFPEIKPSLDKIKAELTKIVTEDTAFAELTHHQQQAYTQISQLYSDAKTAHSHYKNDLDNIKHELTQQETLLLKIEKEMQMIERSHTKKQSPSNT